MEFLNFKFAVTIIKIQFTFTSVVSHCVYNLYIIYIYIYMGYWTLNMYYYYTEIIVMPLPTSCIPKSVLHKWCAIEDIFTAKYVSIIQFAISSQSFRQHIIVMLINNGFRCKEQLDTGLQAGLFYNNIHNYNIFSRKIT